MYITATGTCYISGSHDRNVVLLDSESSNQECKVITNRRNKMCWNTRLGETVLPPLAHSRYVCNSLGASNVMDTIRTIGNLAFSILLFDGYQTI